MWNTNLPTAWLWVDKDKQGLGASHWGNLKKTMQIWKWKNNQNQYFQILTWKDPGPISGGSTRSLAFSRQTERCLRWKRKKGKSWKKFSKNYLSSTVGQIAVGGRTWSWKFDINLTNIIGFHPRVRPHSSFSAFKTKNPMFPFLPLFVFFPIAKIGLLYSFIFRGF